jgi:peptidoglycan/xylan/chitin deacetylase (PgdA/CDA1 family)
MRSLAYLMYHEVELPGRAVCQSDPGYVRYVIDAADFERQMQWLKDGQWQALSVSEALRRDTTRGVAITFDDGCETDLLVAAPILQSFNFTATFYITYTFLDRDGYLSREQVRTLSDMGFEIGCHSMTHAYLTDLNEDGLHREVVESKLCLERLLGKTIEHFSCPGGRYDLRVARVVKAAGYRSLATSRLHRNSAQTNPYALGRVAVMRGMRIDEFAGLCEGRGLWRMKLRSSLQQGAKHLLGNALYDRARAAVLK